MPWIGLILSCKKKNLLETPKKNLTKVHKSKKALKHRTVGSANVPVCAYIYIYFTTRNWKEPHPSRDMWHVMSWNPHAWVPPKTLSRGPESEKLLVETSGNFANRKVFCWMPFPNNVSFAVFSHSKGLGTKWHVCCWGILSDYCLETKLAKKKCVAIAFFQVGDMMLFYTESMQLPTNWLFPKSFDSAGSSPMARPMFWPYRRSRSNFWAQVASPLDVQLMRDPLLCSVAGSTACRCHDLARPKKTGSSIIRPCRREPHSHPPPDHLPYDPHPHHHHHHPLKTLGSWIYTTALFRRVPPHATFFIAHRSNNEAMVEDEVLWEHLKPKAAITLPSNIAMEKLEELMHVSYF